MQYSLRSPLILLEALCLVVACGATRHVQVLNGTQVVKSNLTSGILPSPMDAIDLMRAEVCAQMYDKHIENYAAFEKCKEFMNLFCRPGKDRMMDGDKKEISTGHGYCRLFFPISKKIKEALEKAKKKKEDLLGKSSYDRKPGKVVGKPFEGDETQRQVPDSQAKCQAAGDKCVGFTCDVRETSCRLRGPPGDLLKDSTSGEVSYLKPEEEFDNDDKDGNEDESGSKDGDSADAGKGHASYGRHAGKTLGKPLPGEESAGPAASYERCEALGPACAGFTCDREEKVCTLRGPGNLVDCPDGSVSYMKPIPGEGGAGGNSSDGAATGGAGGSDASGKGGDGGAGAGGEGSAYAHHPGKTLGEPLSGEKELQGVAASQARCDELGDVCAGFTCDKSEEVCTLRGPGDLVSCPDGSVSYLKEGGGQSNQTSSSLSDVNIHMDQGQGAKAQGFRGPKVKHDDLETSTQDWLQEHHDHEDAVAICKDHPNNDWCQKQGYGRLERAAARAPPSPQKSEAILSANHPVTRILIGGLCTGWFAARL